MDPPEDDRDQFVADSRPKDVLICAGTEQLAGTWVDCIGSNQEAYWRVSGTSRQSAPGQCVWFTREGERIFAVGEITALDDGRLWFDGAHPVDLPCPDDAPARGSEYIEPLLPRLDQTVERTEPLVEAHR